MKTIRRLFIYPFMLSLSTILVACNHPTQSPVPSNQPTLKTSNEDGSIASIQLVKQYSGTIAKEYDILYWSNGVEVEALLTEPTKPGHYPLLVNLHGGYYTPGVTSTTSIGYTEQQAAAYETPDTVVLFPEYQGYMKSQGIIRGISGDLSDIENAITVAKSLHEVANNDTYVLGYSLGGGLALMTADVDSEVRAVVAVSPLVGLNDFVTWAKQNVKPGSHWYGALQAVEASYGNQPGSTAYNEMSPDINKINAPVLLLQGTADDEIPWQTVQMFYRQMKQAKKNVKLVLYPSGQHGLHVTYALQSNQEIRSWFKTYGLNDVQMFD